MLLFEQFVLVTARVDYSEITQINEGNGLQV